MRYYDVVVIGGGPAGLAAAITAREHGAAGTLILERDSCGGGILNQCIHNGFGLHEFGEELTGPEYAERFLSRLDQAGVGLMTDTMVLNISPELCIQALNPTEGYFQIQAGAIVLAMGCRERTRGAIGIPGARPAGIFTAGSAQRYVNVEGCMVGRRVLIVGSGDIGLIMARRMTLEGAAVVGCVEIMPYSSGLTRNIVQCLDDYGIPLYLSHTVTDIIGRDRVERVVVSQVDRERRPVPGTERSFDCDTILLSVGLIPENELTRQAGVEIDPRTGGPWVWEDMQTSCPGIFACGNVVHVHDLVDFVSQESRIAGAGAARYLKRRPVDGPVIEVQSGAGVSYTVPQRLRPQNLEQTARIFFRTRAVYKNAVVVVEQNGRELARIARAHMAPGEMEQVRIPASRLGCGPLKLYVLEKDESA